MLNWLSELFLNKPRKDPRELLKLATAKKKEGELEEAVSILRKAYKVIAKGNTTYGIKTFLRLPNYLQKAGRGDEAWSEYNRLLNEGYPNQIDNFSVITMEHSKIYDKMRLFLQREGKKEKAVVFGVLSELAWARGLHLQNRTSELKTFSNPENIEGRISSLVNKANIENDLARFVDIISSEMENPKNIDLTRASKKANHLISSAT